MHRRTIDWLMVLALVVPGAAAAEVTNRIVARVNDRILTLHDFQARYDQTLAQVQEIPQDPDEREALQIEIAERTMRQLWDEMLITSRAEQKGWSVTDAQVKDQIDRMLEANGLESEEQFRQALDEAGVSYASWREGFEAQLRYRMVISRDVYSEIELEDEDLRRYYRANPKEFEVAEQIQVREVVALEGDGDAAMNAVAAEVLEKLRAGATLESLEGQYPSSALSGTINLGWVDSEDLSPQIASALSTMEAGQFSDPVAARGGLHIVELVERREASVRPFAEVEEALRNKLENEMVQERLTSYLVELEEQAYIELDPPAIAAGFRTSSGETPLASTFEFIEAEFEDELVVEEESTELEVEAIEAAPEAVEDFNAPVEDFNAPRDEPEPSDEDSDGR